MTTPTYKFPGLRKASRAIGLTTFIALSTYVLTTTLNPHGAGDKMFHYVHRTYDQVSESLNKILDGN